MCVMQACRIQIHIWACMHLVYAVDTRYAAGRLCPISTGHGLHETIGMAPYGEAAGDLPSLDGQLHTLW